MRAFPNGGRRALAVAGALLSVISVTGCSAAGSAAPVAARGTSSVTASGTSGTTGQAPEASAGADQPGADPSGADATAATPSGVTGPVSGGPTGSGSPATGGHDSTGVRAGGSSGHPSGGTSTPGTSTPGGSGSGGTGSPGTGQSSSPGAGSDSGSADGTGTGTGTGNGDGTGTGTGTGVTVREADVQVGGLSRHYTLVLPRGASAASPVRTLLVLHGWNDTARGLAVSSGIEATALANGLAVLEPEGYGHSWNAGRCCGTAVATGVDDVAALRAVLTDAGADGVALTSRPYVLGFSNGGMMTYRWLCAGGAARAAAVLNGSLMVACGGGTRAPLLHLTGLADNTVPTEGIAASPYLGTSVMAARDSLTAATGCASLAVGSSPAAVAHVFVGCGRATLVTVDGLGHRLHPVGGFSPGPYAVRWLLRHG